MKVLIVDSEKVGLPIAMKAQEAGHDVRLWAPGDAGVGIVARVKDWEASVRWADLIILTDNAKLGKEMEPFFKLGFPIFGPNLKGAELELDREAGQKLLDKLGIDTLPYQQFNNYDKAIKYVLDAGEPFVSKPWGGEADKDLSYVPKTAADLICRLERWKKAGVKSDFLLQKMVKGYEMAVGGWFGPGGWSKWINENWEEKRMLCGGLGPNTGEMGTVMRYVRESSLFDEVLRPCEDYLAKIGYVGYVDMNCMVDEDGTPWPLEFTCRPGWPHFNIASSLHEGDPVEWMADALEGKDTLECCEDVAVGVVLATGDYPWNLVEEREYRDWPIRGITGRLMPNLWLNDVKIGPAPVEVDGEIKTKQTYVTTGTYVMIVTGHGDSVKDAQAMANTVAEKVWWPRHTTRRTDIGDRLEKDLPKLQAFGYADGLSFC